jgi:hypothetical protein
MPSKQNQAKQWSELLAEEDLSFIKRFVLASGSLKEMAKVYGVTYPTIRLRLDRLIQKVKVLDEDQQMSQFERLARALYAEGKIDLSTFRTLLAAHEAETEGQDEVSTGSA